MTVETTLTHGLQTSVLGTAYKAEYDQNITALDSNRITTVAATVAALPAAGAAGRFAFVEADGSLYYDNGTAWVSPSTTGLAGASGTMLVTLAADQALAANTLPQDVLFASIAYRTGTLSGATLDGTGGIVIPTGVTKIKYASRVSLGGASPTTPISFQLYSTLNHSGVPSEGSGQSFYLPGNSSGKMNVSIGSPATIDVVAADVLDTRIQLYGGESGISVLNLSTNLTAVRSWMYIEAVA